LSSQGSIAVSTDGIDADREVDQQVPGLGRRARHLGQVVGRHPPDQVAEAGLPPGRQELRMVVGLDHGDPLGAQLEGLEQHRQDALPDSAAAEHHDPAAEGRLFQRRHAPPSPGLDPSRPDTPPVPRVLITG
jgi:hypothetical protein